MFLIYIPLSVSIECLLYVRHCVVCTEVNSVSKASKISSMLTHELEIITVLDGKFHYLGEVHIKCCGIQGKRKL